MQNDICAKDKRWRSRQQSPVVCDLCCALNGNQSHVPPGSSVLSTLLFRIPELNNYSVGHKGDFVLSS